MQISLVPIVVSGQTHPLVSQVRKALNTTGDNTLDRPLMELIRGTQHANGMPAHGELDEQTLALWGIIAY